MAASAILAPVAIGAGASLQRAVTRRAIEDQIEALIAALDELDGDADSEEADPAEASLGWSLTYATGTNDEREEDRQCAC